MTPIRWLVVQFVSSCFLIEKINTFHTGVVILDNLWARVRYFGTLSFYCTCNCWYFIRFFKICVNHCHSTIIKPFHSNHVIVVLKIDIISFHIFIFFHNSYIFMVTWNCTKAAYSLIVKLLNQCCVGELKNFY